MTWPFSIRNAIYPKERFIWVQIKIIRETDKAILVDSDRKIWIPKSNINGIRLRNNTFEIYVGEQTVG